MSELPRSFWGTCSLFGGAELALGADFLEIPAEGFEVGVGEMFDLNHFVAGVF